MSKLGATVTGFILCYFVFGILAAAVHLNLGIQFAIGIPLGLLGAVGARAAWEQGKFGGPSS